MGTALDDGYYSDNFSYEEAYYGYGYNDVYYLDASHIIKGNLATLNICLIDHIEKEDWNRMNLDERKQFLIHLAQKLINLEVTFGFYAYAKPD